MIKAATVADAHILAELASAMWDGHTLTELATEFAELIASEKAVCFIAYVSTEPVGFAQCQLRNDYVEGTVTSPVGYLEGVFVREEFRHMGLARALVRACEQWASAQGCTEFASDCELDNTGSYAFHMAMGFEEAGRIVCFRKELG